MFVVLMGMGLLRHPTYRITEGVVALRAKRCTLRIPHCVTPLRIEARCVCVLLLSVLFLLWPFVHSHGVLMYTSALAPLLAHMSLLLGVHR
jgi:hypothetical protein